MNWMVRWPGDYPVFVDHAEGAQFWDVDGNQYVDLCLGDTGGMAGHGPKAAVDAIAERAAKGITLMLPTEDAIWVGGGLRRASVWAHVGTARAWCWAGARDGAVRGGASGGRLRAADLETVPTAAARLDRPAGLRHDVLDDCQS